MIIIEDQKHLEDIKNNGLVCLKFSAQWCSPCSALKPIVAKLEPLYQSISFCDIDIDDNREIAKEYGVRSIPTLIFLKDGKEEKRIVGMRDFKFLNELIQELTGEENGKSN